MSMARAARTPASRRATSPTLSPPVRHEPKIAEFSDKLIGIGLKPFHLPLGILLDQKAGGFATPTSVCIRCSAFDGFPCLLNGKADAQVICIDPMLAKHDNVTMLTGAYVSKLGTDAAGRTHRRGACHARRPRGDLHRRHGRGRVRRALVGAVAAAIRERHSTRTGWQTVRTRSGATTCATR